MITSLPPLVAHRVDAHRVEAHRVEAHHGALPAAAGLHERCPFLEQVGEVHAQPRRRVQPPASRWPVETDARAHAVLGAFERSGGMASANEVTVMLRRRTSQPISTLARWIAERQVVHFAWQGEYLLPMFQFERADMGPRADVATVLRELGPTFEDWDLAAWFALPNSWLADEAPIDVLDRDLEAVRQAARADRFVACG